MIHQVSNMNVVPIKNNNIPLMQQNHVEQQNFGTILKNALENVSKAEKISNDNTNALVMGQPVQLHDVMISAQKAKITVETAVEIQQKVIDTYNEIMRMQI